MSQNNKTAAMLVFQTSPLGVELFSLCKRFRLFQEICIDTGHVSENTLLDDFKIIPGKARLTGVDNNDAFVNVGN